MSTNGCQADVMQVCRNGHVMTDLLHTHPERGRSHCDRCGAETLDHCGTCGQELSGAVPVPGLAPVGAARPPAYCPICGAAFPWAPRSAPHPAGDPLHVLEPMLRRLPRMIRQLRSRHGNRPPFQVRDAHDLEDLLRALLPLHFDDIRIEGRTPGYAAGTRTDLVLPAEAIALIVKAAGHELRETDIGAQWAEDLAYYRRRGGCRTVIGFVYDGEALLVGPAELEAAWSARDDELALRCIIAQ
jgi:REase_DpnII-MboI/Uncharacterized protein conserved in bacteria (DUF2321)